MRPRHGDHRTLGANLEQALSFYGMSHSYENKKEMRELGGRGEPYTPEEATALVEYCLADVLSEERLLGVLQPKLDPSAVYRGHYMKCVATIHHRGIPFDVPAFNAIKDHALEPGRNGSDDTTLTVKSLTRRVCSRSNCSGVSPQGRLPRQMAFD